MVCVGSGKLQGQGMHRCPFRFQDTLAAPWSLEARLADRMHSNATVAGSVRLEIGIKRWIKLFAMACNAQFTNMTVIDCEILLNEDCQGLSFATCCRKVLM